MHLHHLQLLQLLLPQLIRLLVRVPHRLDQVLSETNSSRHILLAPTCRQQHEKQQGQTLTRKP